MCLLAGRRSLAGSCRVRRVDGRELRLKSWQEPVPRVHALDSEMERTRNAVYSAPHLPGVVVALVLMDSGESKQCCEGAGLPWGIPARTGSCRRCSGRLISLLS